MFCRYDFPYDKVRVTHLVINGVQIERHGKRFAEDESLQVSYVTEDEIFTDDDNSTNTDADHAKSMLKCIELKMRRGNASHYVNKFNPTVMLTFRWNNDINVMVSCPGLIHYITNYVGKGPDAAGTGMNALQAYTRCVTRKEEHEAEAGVMRSMEQNAMRRCIVMLLGAGNNQETGACRAAYMLLYGSCYLHSHNFTNIFIPQVFAHLDGTAIYGNIVRTKSGANSIGIQGQERLSDSYTIVPTIYDYAFRHPTLKHLSLYAFTSWFEKVRIHSKKQSNADDNDSDSGSDNDVNDAPCKGTTDDDDIDEHAADAHFTYSTLYDLIGGTTIRFDDTHPQFASFRCRLRHKAGVSVVHGARVPRKETIMAYASVMHDVINDDDNAAEVNSAQSSSSFSEDEDEKSLMDIVKTAPEHDAEYYAKYFMALFHPWRGDSRSVNLKNGHPNYRTAFHAWLPTASKLATTIMANEENYHDLRDLRTRADDGNKNDSDDDFTVSNQRHDAKQKSDFDRFRDMMDEEADQRALLMSSTDSMGNRTVNTLSRNLLSLWTTSSSKGNVSMDSDESITAATLDFQPTWTSSEDESSQVPRATEAGTRNCNWTQQWKRWLNAHPNSDSQADDPATSTTRNHFGALDRPAIITQVCNALIGCQWKTPSHEAIANRSARVDVTLPKYATIAYVSQQFTLNREQHAAFLLLACTLLRFQLLKVQQHPSSVETSQMQLDRMNEAKSLIDKILRTSEQLIMYLGGPAGSGISLNLSNHV